jgi:hypothetical protein
MEVKYMATIVMSTSNKVVIALNNTEIEITCEAPNSFDEEIIKKIWEDIDE